MPTMARPEVDVLERLTTAILVDQAANGLRSPVHRRDRQRRERDAQDPAQPDGEAEHRLAAGVSRPARRPGGVRAVVSGAGKLGASLTGRPPTLDARRPVLARESTSR